MKEFGRMRNAECGARNWKVRLSLRRDGVCSDALAKEVGELSEPGRRRQAQSNQIHPEVQPGPTRSNQIQVIKRRESDQSPSPSLAMAGQEVRNAREDGHSDESESKWIKPPGVREIKMRKSDVDFQKNLGKCHRRQLARKTWFSCHLNAADDNAKKFIKTACEIFHDAASFHALRQKLVLKPRDFIPVPGVFC